MRRALSGHRSSRLQKREADFKKRAGAHRIVAWPKRPDGASSFAPPVHTWPANPRLGAYRMLALSGSSAGESTAVEAGSGLWMGRTRGFARSGRRRNTYRNTRRTSRPELFLEVDQ